MGTIFLDFFYLPQFKKYPLGITHKIQVINLSFVLLRQ